MFVCHFWWAKRKILCGKYISYIFHVFSEARDHILMLNILFFNKIRQIIPEIRSERRDLLIFIFILKTTGTCTPVHSAGYLILRNEFRSTQEVAMQNIQVSFYIRSTGYLNTCVTIFGNNQKRNTHFKGSNRWSKYTTLIKYTLGMGAYKCTLADQGGVRQCSKICV